MLADPRQRSRDSRQYWFPEEVVGDGIRELFGFRCEPPGSGVVFRLRSDGSDVRECSSSLIRLGDASSGLFGVICGLQSMRVVSSLCLDGGDCDQRVALGAWIGGAVGELFRRGVLAGCCERGRDPGLCLRSIGGDDAAGESEGVLPMVVVDERDRDLGQCLRSQVRVGDTAGDLLGLKVVTGLRSVLP